MMVIKKKRLGQSYTCPQQPLRSNCHANRRPVAIVLIIDHVCATTVLVIPPAQNPQSENDIKIFFWKMTSKSFFSFLVFYTKKKAQKGNQKKKEKKKPTSLTGKNMAEEAYTHSFSLSILSLSLDTTSTKRTI